MAYKKKRFTYEYYLSDNYVLELKLEDLEKLLNLVQTKLGKNHSLVNILKNAEVTK